MAGVKTGEMAPEFHLMDQSGVTHSLAKYRGQWLVLYFYPKDDTPGCTKEACGFRDDNERLAEMGVALLGVSTDNIESHQAFSEKYHLPFPLLSDADGEVAKRYGSLWQLGPIKFAKRHSFLIDPEGRIAHIYRDVTPKTHSDEVINRLQLMGVEQSKE
jgi:peroxiredoxin Q/BCP